MNSSLICFLFLVSLFLSQPTNAEKAESSFYNPVIAKSNSEASLNKDAPVYEITLPSIYVDIPPTGKGPLQTGIIYQLPEPVTNSQLAWNKVEEGYVTRIHLFADQAKRLRFRLRFLSLQFNEISLRVQGNLDSTPLGPINRPGTSRGELWLPITNGDSADLEVFIRSSDYPNSPIFVLEAINFIVVDHTDSSVIPYSLGYTEHKEYDLACWSGSSEYNGLTQAAAATAKIHYIASNNISYTCTGTLLNDGNSTNTPWFATANHCLPDQATADTASFEWFFQATKCGSNNTDSRSQQTYNGALLLWTDFNLEASFLRLNHRPPSGVSFAGWQTDINVGDLVWGVHHPKGDHTMVSKGNVVGLSVIVEDAHQGGIHTLNRVKFFQGGTEIGSSGSGLFSADNTGNAYWKGTLFGGPESDYQDSSYSNFDKYYSNISGWLRNTVPVPPTSTRLACVFDWIELRYPELAPSNKESEKLLLYLNYIYRFYKETNFYLGYSVTDNHLYSMSGADGIIRDAGSYSDYEIESMCYIYALGE